MFTLTETETETDGIGFYDNVQKSTHYTVTETEAKTVADANGFRAQFNRSRSLSRFGQCKYAIKSIPGRLKLPSTDPDGSLNLKTSLCINVKMSKI